MKETEYFAPGTVEEALDLLSRYGSEAKVLAGGTDLVPKLNERKISPGALVFLGNIAGLTYIREEGDSIKIGPLTTYSELLGSSLVRNKIPVLAEAAAQTGDPTVRNAGTMGGNIVTASPSADAATALLALGAELRLVSKNGIRMVALKDFFTGPGKTVLQPDELVEDITVPSAGSKSCGKFLKLGLRKGMAIAVVNVAVVLSRDANTGVCQDVGIALGAVSPTPVRASKAEAQLRGAKADEETIKKAAALVAEEINPITDVRAPDWYRRETAKVLVERAIRQALN